MALYISSLSSGSNGNCYYIGNDEEAVLVDAGISCREIEKRVTRSGLDMHRIKAVFISHEHTDHIYGLRVLAKKHRLPIYITTNTFQHCNIPIDEQLVHVFDAREPVTVGRLKIFAFRKHHDACDPHSFLVEYDNIKVGVLTDIGTACDEVIRCFRQCHAAFLEANYDEQMLASGSYPYYLKKRISGGNGHLSNDKAMELFVKHRHNGLSHLILSHLSQNNNCPQLVEKLFSQHAGPVQIIVAPRYSETPVYKVICQGSENLEWHRKPILHTKVMQRPLQLSMF